MDASKRELYGRFQAIAKSHVEYRHRETPDCADQDWVVRSYDDPQRFMAEVERNFPSWREFAKWLDDLERQEGALRQQLEDDISKLSAEGVSGEDLQRVKKIPAPDWLNKRKRGTSNDPGRG